MSVTDRELVLLASTAVGSHCLLGGGEEPGLEGGILGDGLHHQVGVRGDAFH
jgi:hypothetical protein